MPTKIFLVLVFSVVSLVTTAQDVTSLRKNQFNISDDGIAIKGYDPVAYFNKGEGIKGKKEFSLYHQGIVYYFSSVKNKEVFKKNPAAYEPQYGGWCAYAMGEKGEKVSIDPETFKIIDNKLYLFYSRFFNNTLKSWNKNEANLKHNADANWMIIFHN